MNQCPILLEVDGKSWLIPRESCSLHIWECQSKSPPKSPISVESQLCFPACWPRNVLLWTGFHELDTKLMLNIFERPQLRLPKRECRYCFVRAEVVTLVCLELTLGPANGNVNALGNCLVRPHFGIKKRLLSSCKAKGGKRPPFEPERKDKVKEFGCFRP